MAILKVARMGHPVLRARALSIPAAEIASPPVQRLIDDMFETMREYSGIGLAAPQVHESVRVFVAGLRRTETVGDMDNDEDMPLVALINPEITPMGKADEAVEGWEGCLSIPDVRGLVPRAREIKVSAYDRAGRKIQLTARGLPARVIQHENDHLDGVLFFDRMRSFDSLAFLDEYSRYWAKDRD